MSSAKRDVDAPGYVWVMSFDHCRLVVVVMEVAVLLRENTTIDLKVTKTGCELVYATLGIDAPSITC